MAPLAVPKLDIQIKEYMAAVELEPTTFEPIRAHNVASCM